MQKINAQRGISVLSRTPPLTVPAALQKRDLANFMQKINAQRGISVLSRTPPLAAAVVVIGEEKVKKHKNYDIEKIKV